MIDPADLVVPDQPDVRPMHLMHRGHNGFIAVTSKANPARTTEMEHWYSVRARDLVGVFPQLMPQLDAESYYSVHGFYRGGYGKSRHAPEGMALPAAHRKGDDVRWLTCAFADIDDHDGRRTYGKTFGLVIDAQEAGEIPPVTMFQRSGRGLWCFWFLRDRHDDAPAKDWPAAGPVRAWPEKVQLWCAIQRVIGERLAALGSDANARDLARVTRVPGSINAKVGLRVGYHLQLDDHGRPFVYTLDDLAELLDVAVRPMGREIREVDAKLSAFGQRGAAGRWRHDLHRFRTLCAIRGTWRIGLRNNAALILGRILLSLKGADRPSPGKCFDELVQLWKTFEQRPGDVYSLDDLKKLWHGLPTTKPKRPLRHQKISDMLDVTPEESRLLVSGGKAWPAAARFSLLAHRPPATLAELAEHRRDALRAILAARDGVTPTLRDLVDMLLARGIDTTTATVRKDLVAIGVTNPRARREVSPAGPELFPG